MKKVWQYGVIAWLALMPWGTVFIGRDSVSEYQKILMFGTEVVWWFLFGWAVWFRYVPKPRVSVGVWCLFGWLWLSVWWADDYLLGLQLVRYAIMAISIGWLLAHNHELASRARYAFGVGMLPVLGLGIGQFFTQETWSSVWLGLSQHRSWEPGASVVVGEFGRWLRAYGSWPHPNIFGGYLVFTLLVSATAIKVGQQRFFWLVIAGLSSACLIFTFSRSAWLGLVVAFVFGWKWFKDERLRLWFGVVSLTIAITAWLVWPLIIGRTQIVGAQEQQSVSERVSGWHEAATIWQMSPWRGVGLGNYTVALQQKFPGSPTWAYQPVHNLGLLLLAEVGIVGVGILVIIFWGLFKKYFWQLWWFAPLLVIGLFDHYLLTLYPGWLLIGLWVGFGPRSMHS